MNSKIGFTALRKLISEKFLKFKDKREKKLTDYSLHDIIMSAFAAMFYQSPSLLHFQSDLENKVKNNNLRTQFGVKNIPSTTQLKDVLDEVSSKRFESVFDVLHQKLDKIKVINEFENNLNTLFLSGDGTQYYTSQKVHCKKCLVKHHKNKPKSYSHQVFQSAIVLPGKKVVIPTMPTEVCNDSGINNTKQDSEWKAFFRHLDTLKRSHFKDKSFTILLDALFADQVVINKIEEHDYNYIIVSKPNDNKYLHEEYSLVTTKKESLEIEDDKYTHSYFWSNDLPMNSRRKLSVNFVSYEMKKVDKRTGDEKVVYKNTWITNHLISSNNVSDIVLGGRSRWKVENECFNTLKNQGYNLEHSYGHGEKNLSFNFVILTMLAFYLHQFLEDRFELYQACRKKFSSKRSLWEKLRTYIQIVIFDSFELLLEFTLNPELCTSTHNLSLARAGP